MLTGPMLILCSVSTAILSCRTISTLSTRLKTKAREVVFNFVFFPVPSLNNCASSAAMCILSTCVRRNEGSKMVNWWSR
ncbi:hypothetical protein C8Q79DRAFT_961710 [Trametes meyenii]|nr:hypothetical protein C8Q79DRAFT_961710 [Trametes meyenii]